MADRVRVILVRGLAGKSAKKRAVLDALGLRRRGSSTVKVLTPSIKGMIDRVKELVSVEKIEGEQS